jgi:MYXO-CTERM domain-containing protein
LGVGHGAISVNETFEGSSAGSTTPPTGWSLKTMAGTGSYATSAAAAGSNGAGGSTGLAGIVTANTVYATDLPGAYLYNTATFDLTQNLSGSFDFQMVHDSTFDDVIFLLGDISGGLTKTNGQVLSSKFTEASSSGRAGTLNAGSGAEADRLDISNVTIADDTWFTASFSWEPISGTTGDFSITVNNFTSDVFTLATTGYTFNSADAQIGFGSVNDVIKFDNVSVTGSPIPEPRAALLGGLGLLALLRRRR